jgi:hypothetical protein
MKNDFKVPPGRLRGFLMGVSLLACMLLSGASLAQSGLTVDQIIAMHKAGVPASIIEQNIKMTGAKYRLTVKDLKKLKKAKVPNKIVGMMKGKRGSAAPMPAKDDLEKMKESREFQRRKAEQEAEIKAAADAARTRKMAEVESQEKVRIENALSAARRAYKSKKYAEAARLFFIFIGETDPSRPAVKEARLGMAASFAALGLYGNAALEYLGLVEEGPSSSTFRPAFSGLRNVAKQTPIDSEKVFGLLDFQDVDAPKAFQNSYNYFIGKFLFTKGEFDRARNFLSAVDNPGGNEKSTLGSRADYARAQYMLGLILVEESQRSAKQQLVLLASTAKFQTAIATAEGVDDDNMRRVSNLAYLGLARAFYTAAGLFPADRRDLMREFYDVAIYYYRKVPVDSTNYVNAAFESGWSYYFRGDYRRGLGFFHALDGPEWSNYFMPGVYLAEADMYVAKCHVDSAKAALSRFNEKFSPVRPAVEAYLNANPDPGSLFNAFVLGQSAQGQKLPNAARNVLITDSEFYEAFTEVDRLREELASINGFKADFGEKLAGKLKRRVEGITEEKRMYLGVIIQNILQRKLIDEIEYFESKRQDLEDDIYQAQSIANKEAIAALTKGQSLASAAKEQQAASLFVGNRYIRWPFEGSFWEDEVKNYRSNLDDRCQ